MSAMEKNEAEEGTGWVWGKAATQTFIVITTLKPFHLHLPGWISRPQLFLET